MKLGKKWSAALNAFLLGYTFIGTAKAVDSETAKPADPGLDFTFDRAVTSADLEFLDQSDNSHDRVLYGSTVVIKEELRTYGGNIIIIADRLVMNAPIDTRIYIKPKRFWQVSRNTDASLDRMLEYSPAVLQTFGDYYLWHEYYDPATHRYKFAGAPIEQMKQGQVVFPAMPFGIVPTGVLGSKFQGEPTDVAREGMIPFVAGTSAYRSGSITIYARSIEFCEDCRRTQYEDPPVAGGDLNDKETVRFLVARGLKGGLAGLGGVQPGVYNAPPSDDQFRLNWDDPVFTRHIGGTSSGPGRGGDAGDITIHLIESPEQARRELLSKHKIEECASTGCTTSTFDNDVGASIAALSDVSGGLPAQNRRLQTPSIEALSRTPGRQAFAPEGSPTGEDGSLRGSAGKLTIDELTPEAAVASAGAQLSTIDLDPKYDLPAATKRILNSPIAVSPLARDVLSAFLGELLVSRQTRLLEATPKLLTRDSRMPLQVDLMTGLSCSEESTYGVLDIEAELLRRICEFKQYGGRDPLRSYFYRTGGLFRLSPTATVESAQLERVLAEAERIDVSLNEILNHVTSLESMFYKFVTDQTRQNFENRIETLQKALDSAITALNAHSDILSEIIGIGKDSQTHINAIQKVWVEDNPNYFSVAGEFGAAIGPLTRFIGILSGKDLTADQRRAVNQARKDLEELKRAYTEFLQEASDMKRELASEQLRDLEYLLAARTRVSGAKRYFSLGFENLLRASLLEYLSDPFRNQDTLHGSLRTIEDFLKNFPNQKLAVLPVLPRIDCRGVAPIEIVGGDTNPVGCFLTNAKATTFALISRPSARIGEFPLLVVAAGKGSYLASFMWLISSSQLEERQTGVAVRSWSPSVAEAALP